MDCCKFKIKKNIKITVFFAAAILLLSVFIIALDYLCYFTYPNTGYKNKTIKHYLYTYSNKTEDEIKDKFIFDKGFKIKYRKTENINSKEEAVIIFGFSGIYGMNLKEDETISHYLGKLIPNPIYNRAKAESSLNHMLYQLSDEDFYKIVPKAKYIIYFYNPKQLYLMNHKLDFCQHDIYYKLNKGKLERYKKVPLIKKSFLMARVNIGIFRKGLLNNFYYAKNGKLLKTILIESKKEAQKHFGGNLEFIVVEIYDEKNKFSQEIFKDLNNFGFKIIKLYEKTDTSSKQYIEKKSNRPNKKLWKETAEVLSKELN